MQMRLLTFSFFRFACNQMLFLSASFKNSLKIKSHFSAFFFNSIKTERCFLICFCNSFKILCYFILPFSLTLLLLIILFHHLLRCLVYSFCNPHVFHYFSYFLHLFTLSFEWSFCVSRLTGKGAPKC